MAEDQVNPDWEFAVEQRCLHCGQHLANRHADLHYNYWLIAWRGGWIPVCCMECDLDCCREICQLRRLLDG